MALEMRSLFGRSPAWVFAAVLMLGGFGLGLGMRALDWLDGALGVALMLALVLALGLVGAVSYWRRLDEAAREAHKFAWYWGGSVGVGVALVIAITLAKTDLVAVGFAGSSTPGELVSLGMMAAMGLQVACYLVVWAGWWLSKR